ncbi:hypothetical protein RchiOBHm_Chr4g0411731 [Rosa chinensis]|uniref:Uncharacterized protein n=1 Tax=Rosa chinensis TaxID=74649 RepID=A0A2P6QVS7_ROSCH|nr:hypothetical protein RchiOBHm_Chr4g0411731 [Rosa chinensis]
MRQHCVAYLDCTWILIQLVGHSTFNDEQRRLSVYAAMFLPLRKTMYKDRKAKDVPVGNYIFTDSLKQRVSNAETVINLHDALEKFLSLLPHFVQNGDVKLAEVDMGREYVDLPLTSKESNLRVLTGLDKVRDVKPLLNGKEIMDALQLKPGGPLVSKWQRKLPAWQLAHPLGTAEECLKWLKEAHSSSTRSAGDMEELNGTNNKKSKTEDRD